jgi:dolichyl-phosphate beta-glucosyltransferase
MSRLELSVVIPVYNESARVGKTLQESFAYLKSKKNPSEIIVVDDGSRDDTVKIVNQFKRLAGRGQSLKVLQQPINRGKGAAVRTGALAALGKTVLFMDADNSTPLREFENFKPLLKEGFEVLIGSRAVDRKKVKVHQPLHREAMGRVFNLMVQLIATPGLWDTQCGFKVFSRRAAQAIFPLQTIERFGFDVELLYIGRKLGFKVREVSVHWFDNPASKVHVFRDSTQMFLDLLIIRWNDLRGRYSNRKSS